MVIYTFYTSVSKPLATMGKTISHSTAMYRNGNLHFLHFCK
ncbi:hypothetical protein PROFUN_13677 [Planoprotostelium fungivorum]|uniref:Uncharacterized protein n=1 Tax=Planoprotostelium fungivorum TaxID=1890364 RepID=A0A2P6MUJ0_9EUKA|nr:hypothetical protein PROFUN_13677 [Planoprotostelium fungivorum]